MYNPVTTNCVVSNINMILSSPVCQLHGWLSQPMTPLSKVHSIQNPSKERSGILKEPYDLRREIRDRECTITNIKTESENAATCFKKLCFSNHVSNLENQC
ncbi:hypothetical protein TNCT_122601 [Trichonephila clavata]|uniref:Uncharacterized protein n=1 Tax=Trichonephila clavata TaxID=2740835 RepID=A0A8X6HHA4_TRICU|nr:hypothetical protein TNCT_122601 [Trichonephila clavata]